MRGLPDIPYRPMPHQAWTLPCQMPRMRWLRMAVARDRGADLQVVLTDTPGGVTHLMRLRHGGAPNGRPGLSLLTDLVARTQA